MKNIPSQLNTPTDLGKNASQAMTEGLNPLVADAFSLYVKTKNYHWHASGPHFPEYHRLFDEQAAQIYDMIDTLAERVRKLGGLTIHSIGEISKLQTIDDDNESFVAPKKMIERLLEDNKSFASNLRKVHKICEKYNDLATASLLEVFLDETERRIWFLFETCS